MDMLVRLQKAKLELFIVAEKKSACFLHVTCANNAREAWLSLKEQYEPTTVAEEL